MIKGVIWDLDGTLVDSLRDLARSANMALREMGLKTHTVEGYKPFLGFGSMGLIRGMAPGLDSESEQKLLSLYWSYYERHRLDNTALYDGIGEVVNELDNRGIKMAIVSNKHQSSLDAICQNLFRDGLFCAIFGNNPDYPTKPDPTLTLKVIADMGLRPKEVLFIGDSEIDFMTSQNAGTEHLCVSWGFRTKARLIEAGATNIIDRPEQIIEFLDK